LAGCDRPITVGYATDGGEFTELANRVVWGPGDIAQAHTSDEWIDRDQLAKGIELYHRALTQWCLS
jgi:acetylornithine deacetylase